MRKIILFCLFIFTMAAVKAQTVTITDVNFHAALIANGVDTNSDTLIQTSEALEVTSLNVQSYGITNMTGISSFTNLQILDCSGNSLTSLNLTGLSSLQSLSCSNNAITNLDVSSCTALTNLSFTGNPIAVFNASDCTLLSTINGYSGFSNAHNIYIATLTNLNLTNCSALQRLYLGGNNLLNSVQITGCIGLIEITLVSNAILTSFTVSNLPNLTNFEAAYNPQLASLTFTNDTALNYLLCYENALTSLNLSGLPSLNLLNCRSNSLTSLNLNGLTTLVYLFCLNNNLTSLDVSGLSSLYQLNCIGNSGLTCIKVADVSAANSNEAWTKDAAAIYSTTCATTVQLTVTKAGAGAGSVVSSPAGIDCGSTCTFDFSINTQVTLTAVPSLGSVFLGWTGAYVGTDASINVTMDVAKSITANFGEAQFPLTISNIGNGNIISTPAGISCGSSCIANFDIGATVTLTAIPNSGATFLGWGGSCTGTELTCTVTMDSAKSVTATFDGIQVNEFLLTVTKAGAGVGTISSSPAGINCGSTCSSAFAIDTVVTLTAVPSYGSVFTGWSGGGTSGNDATISVTMDAAKSITANFGRAQFPLTISNSGGGTVSSTPAGINCGLNCTANYEFGMNVQLNAIPSSGAIFAGWTGACSGTGPCTVTIDAAKTVNARFTYPLTITRSGTGGGTVTSSPTGISCGSTCTANYDANQMVTLTAISDATSTFVGWSGAVSSSSATINVTMDAAKSINAQFNVIKYTLNVLYIGSHFSEGTWHSGGTITTSPTGINCPSICTAEYTIGTQVTLTAAPNLGYQFNGWSGPCTGIEPCVLTMNSAKSVTATFVCVTPNTPSSISGNAIVCPGATATYSVINDPNASSYTWTLPSGWSGNSTTNSITVTAGDTGTLSVKANSICGSSSASSELVVTVNSLPIDTNENQLSEITADANTIILDHFNAATTGQLYGSINYVPSMNGMGAAAEFKNNNWIRYNYNANLSSSGTIDFWIYAKAYNIPLANINWNTGATSYPGAGHVFHSRINAAGKIDVGAWPTGSFSSNASIPLNTWTRITITWGNNNNIIYINGVADVINTSAFSPSANGNYSIYVPYWGTTNEFYLDEFHVSNKKRTPEEINSVYNLFIDSEMDSVCENTSTNIRITNPEIGISYQLFKENQPFGDSQVGASNPLIFSTGDLNETTNFTVKATNPTSGCYRMLSGILTITVTAQPTWYTDADNDGYPSSVATVTQCDRPINGKLLSELTASTEDCDDTDDTINPDATEVNFNGEDDDCDGSIFNGHAPVVSDVTTPSGALASMTSPIECSVATNTTPYSGASVVHKFRVTRTSPPAAPVEFESATRTFAISSLAIAAYSATYEVQATAIVNGEEQPYNGNTATFTTPAAPVITTVSQISNNQCNQTLSAINSYIYASNGPAVVQLYDFEVIREVEGLPTHTQVYTTTAPYFRLTSLSIPVTYGTTYKVRSRYGYNSFGSEIRSSYSTQCTITTPSLPTVQVVGTQCDQTMASINAFVYSTVGLGSANLYEFRVTRIVAPGETTPAVTEETIQRIVPYFRLTMLENLYIGLGKEYSVSVRYRVNTPGTVPGTQFSDWSPIACSVFTPEFPTTGMVDAQCNLVDFTPSMSQYIYSGIVTGATQYRFRLELFDEMSPTPEVPVYSQSVDSPNNYVTLNQFTGLLPSTTYVVTVSVELFGEFGPYGKDCAVTTPAFAAKATPAMDLGFEATIYPNPFTTNFTLAVETSSQTDFGIKVFDMVGRLVDQRTVSVSEMKKGILGDQYPSGVYNVIITQDEVVKTLRVVKR
ncbi:InlB B-repeat-containing protein [Flavobacterium rivulicola]|nr:LamG-like jellyroll fold domain-containing protein [Flavobacterium sp. IMCC34852]